METQNPLNARTRNRGLRGGRKTAQLMASRPILSGSVPSIPTGKDWQTSGIVDQMLAYRDWWNLPARRHQGAEKALGKADRATGKSDPADSSINRD